MRRKHDARYAFKERKRLGSGTSARVSLAWFLAGSSWFLVTMDHDREIISLVFAPTPPIEGSCE